MTSPSSSPSRRRQRIVVTLAVLVLVSLISWSYWPTGDTRFVGTWEVSYPFEGTRFEGGELSFSTSGKVDSSNFNGRFKPEFYNVSNGYLSLSGQVPWIGRVLPPLRLLLFDWTGNSATGHEQRYRIDLLTQERIALTELKASGKTHAIELIRIAD